MSVEEAKKAIDCFTSADPDSSNPDNDGRRIERVAGGFNILNYQSYRNIQNQMSKQELDREYARRYREKKRQEKLTDTDGIPSRPDSSAYAYASAFTSSFKNSTKKEKRSRVRNGRTTLEEAKAYCLEIGLLESDGQWFFDKCEGCGWKNNGKAIIDWKATVRAWKGIEIFPGQKIVKIESKQELIDKSFDKLKEKYANEAGTKA